MCKGYLFVKRAHLLRLQLGVWNGFAVVDVVLSGVLARRQNDALKRGMQRRDAEEVHERAGSLRQREARAVALAQVQAAESGQRKYAVQEGATRGGKAAGGRARNRG